MIGTVGSDEKAALAKANGCAHTIVYTRENFVERVKQLTGGKGVPVVYDGVGKDTFPASLDCLSPRGMFVSFGNASGAIAAFDILLLSQKGSLYATRPTLATYTASRPAMLKMSEEMFSLVLSGKLANEPRQTYALKDAAQAHRDLQSRKTSGAIILLP
jgi:NADPH2:quinone reductase